MIRRTHNLLQWLLAIFVVYLLVTRLFISWIQFFPQQFASTVHTFSGVETQFENIELTQSWLGFDVSLKNVQAKSTEFEFHAASLKFDFNLFYFFLPSLEYGESLVLDSGSLQFASLGNESTEKALSSEQSSFDFNSLHAYNPDVDRLWKRVHLQNFIISELSPKLTVQINEFQSLKKSNLNLISEFSLSYADVLDYEPFNLRATLQPNIWGTIDNGDIALSSFKPLLLQRIKSLLPASWSSVLPNGEFILDVKTQMANAKISSSKINLYAQSLQWKQQYEDLPKSIGLQFDWFRKAKPTFGGSSNWELSLSSIQIDNNFIDSISPIRLYFEGQDDIRFKSEKFDLEPFEVVIKALMETQLAANVIERAVFLSLKDVEGRFAWQTLDLKDIKLYIERLDLPLTDYPGMSVRDLNINKSIDKLTIEAGKPIWVLEPKINAKPMKLELPKLMALGFDANNHAWALPKVALKLNGIPLKIQLSQLNSDYIDTDFNVRFASMSQLKNYLPYSLMSEQLQEWLRSSLQGGENIAVNGRIRGLFNNFPFTDNDGVLELDAKVENARLKFNPKWPELSGFDARISFKPYQIDILTDSVMLNQNLLASDVRVEIPGVDKRDIKLRFTGKVSSQLPQAINYLQTSPISEKVGLDAFFDSGAQFTGDIDVVLDEVLVPISGFEGFDEAVKGHFNLSNAGLRISEQLDFTNIHGRFVFDEKRLDANNIKFNGFAGDGLLSIKTQLNKKQILLQASGKALNVKNNWAQNPLTWKGAVQIPFKSNPQNDITISANANLAKVESLVPYPFDQASIDNKQLNISAKVNQSGGQLNYSVSGLIEGLARLQKTGDEFGIISSQTIIGEKPLSAIKAEKPLSFIKGKVDRVELAPWISFLSKLDFNKTSASNSEKEALKWSESWLDFGSVSYLSNNFQNVKASLDFNAKPFSVSFDGPASSGLVKVADDKINVEVTKLSLITDAQNSMVNGNNKDSKICEPQVVEESSVNLLFEGKNIVVDGKKIDRLKFDLVDSAVLSEFKNIQADFGSGVVNLNASMSVDKLTNKTSFIGEFKSKKVSEVAKLLDIEKGLTGKKANLKLNLNWQGGVDCFVLKEINGDIKFKLREGSIEDVDPGIARLIGLLSIESLVRRLKLDLKDVTNKGFVYDRIDGFGNIKNGGLRLDELKMQAPSANMNMSGKVDLTGESFDLQANVTPKVGATIPTIAALAGSTNPLAALAVYTIMKILPDVNENLVTYEYKITGPWKEPLIKSKNTELLTAPKPINNDDFEEDGLLFE